MADQNRRKYSPIFNAVITVTGDIDEKTTSKGDPYARFQADVDMKGGVAKWTVMAFADRLAKVRESLVPGRPVELAVQRDGGTIKVIGFPRSKPTRIAA